MNWSVVDKDEAASALGGNASGSGGWSESSLTNSGRFIRNKLRAYGTQTFTVNVTTEGEGSVTRSEPGPSYPRGTVGLVLTAVPASGWSFVGWGGDATGTASQLSSTTWTIENPPLYENRTYLARFAQGTGLIKNGNFTSNTQNWASGAGGSGNVSLSIEDATLKVSVTNGGDAQANARLQQGSINLETGKKYELKFRVKASAGGRSVTARFTNTNRDRNYMDPPLKVDLTSAWQNVTQEFDMCYKNAQGTLLSDASAVLLFEFGGSGATSWSWNIDDISLVETGTVQCQGNTGVVAVPSAVRRAGWSVSRVGGSAVLRGPAEAGSKVTLYDVRGKAVRVMEARDGMSLGARNVPAGSYFVVVRDVAGKEVFRDRFSLVQ
jgi:hypothetical protein